MPTTLLKNPVDVNVVSTAVGLQVSGTAADATTGAGAKPSATLSVTGTPGQATTGTGVVAGAGADVSITAGAGGSAPSGATNGQGGHVSITPGAAGGGLGTAGASGNVLIAANGGYVGVGTSTPTATLDIVGTATRTISGTRIGNAAASAAFAVRKANTGVTAVADGHEIGNFAFSGYDGTSYVPGARIRTVVDGAVSTGVVPVAIAISTGGGTLGHDDGDFRRDENAITEHVRITSTGNVGVGTAAPTSRFHVSGGMQVGAPTGGDMGTGSINVAGDIYKNGAAFTNPDYVFERHFTGATDAAYAGPVPLAQLEETIKAHGQLPGVGREPMGVFGRQDALLEKLEEAYLYIIELTKRVERLEGGGTKPITP